jgi:hypothetical protein
VTVLFQHTAQGFVSILVKRKTSLETIYAGTGFGEQSPTCAQRCRILARLAAKDVLVGDQQVAGAIEDQAADPFEAVGPRDDLSLTGAGAGVELLHTVVAAVEDAGVVADVERVAGRRRDGPLLQALHGETRAGGLAGDPRSGRFMGKVSELRGEAHGCLLLGSGLPYNGKTIAVGAQTERRGGAGPGRDLLGGETFPAAVLLER